MELKVGDKVAIRGVRMSRNALHLSMVARVLKRYVVLNDGSKFSLSGEVYPHQPYSMVHLLPLTEDLEKEAREQRFVRILNVTKWADLDFETLEKIVSLVLVADR